MDRKEFFKYAGAASIAATVGGCNFLDEVPKEKSSLKNGFDSKNDARNSLYSCYHFFPNMRGLGASVSLATSDEMAISFTQDAVLYFPRGEYSATHPVFPFWNNLYKGIRHCYIFLNRVGNTPKMSKSRLRDYKAQVKFIVGYLYFNLIRMYGPVIIHKGVAAVDTPVKDFKSRTPLDECVKFTTDLLDEAAKYFPPRRSGQQYGLATSVMAKSVKAKLLLFAASPLFNGGGEDNQSIYTDFKSKDGKQLIPTTYKKEKWRTAADALKEAIQEAHSAGKRLYKAGGPSDAKYPMDPVERDLIFIFCDPETNELVFPGTRKEGTYSFQNNSEPFYTNHSWNGFGTSLQLVESFYTENGLPIDKDPQFDYNDRYNIANGPNGTTMKLNLNREPRFNAWVCYHNSYYAIKKGQKRRLLCGFRKNDNCGKQGRTSNYSPTGYLNKKGVHPLSNDKTYSFQQYPWPRMRLADLYLEYAEALIETGKNFGTAKTYIDKVRQRAGIPKIDDAWAPIGGANDKKTLRSIVRQERTIELYLENQRFWDTRRWMTAEKVLDVPIKGMNIEGVTDSQFFQVQDVNQVRKFYTPRNYLMPIPAGQVNKNPNMVQNPGY
jgi:hypothetical protein